MDNLQFILESKMHAYHLMYLGLIAAMPEFQTAVVKAPSNGDLDSLLGAWGFPVEFRKDFFVTQDYVTAQKNATKGQLAKLDDTYPVSGCDIGHVKSFLSVVAAS